MMKRLFKPLSDLFVLKRRGLYRLALLVGLIASIVAGPTKADFILNELQGFGVGGGIGGNDSFTKILLHMDGSDASTTFTDSSSSARTQTAVGNAQIDTAQSKFGGASGLFDGTGDYVTSPASADFQMTGDWTFDTWVRFTGTGTQALVDGGNTSGLVTITPSSGNVIVYAATSAIINGGATAFNTGQWYHIAVVRSGTSWVFYRDGVSYQTATSSNNWGNGSGVLQVGRYVGGGWDCNCWLEEFRLSKGIARWTVGFTPPSEPYS